MIDTKPSRGMLAALVILTAPPFEGRHEVTDHVHDMWIDFESMTTQWPWSSGELVALHAAWSIYALQPRCPLSDVLVALDRDLAGRVLLAMRMALGMDEVAT